MNIFISILALLLALCGLQIALAQTQQSFSELFIWRDVPLPGAEVSVIPTASGKGNASYLQEILENCGKREFYFDMNSRHIRATTMVTDYLMEIASPSDTIAMAGALRDLDEINPHAWFRAVISARIHRRDMQRLRVPPIVEVMPSLLLPTYVVEELANMTRVSPLERHCILLDETVGRDNGPENLLWYFREDITVNSHHMYWHISYPTNGARGRQDRTGELFYFMHHNFLARHHAERLSVGLSTVRSYTMREGQPMPGFYNPHMHDGNSGFTWSNRPKGVLITDIASDIFGRSLNITISERPIQIGRILDGISNGFLVDTQGQPVSLNNDQGISILSNVMETNVFSINRPYYSFVAGVHNDGHLIIGLALDPTNENDTSPTVMVDTATSMRDPIFYGYHGSIDDIFNLHKDTLPPYQLTEGSWPLTLPGINLRSLKVHSRNLPPNELHTFWGLRRHDLSRGFDFSRNPFQGPLWTCLKHLDHQEFEYELEIEQRESGLRPQENVTVRLLMAPRHAPNGERYSLEEQRRLMFVMDTFTVPVQPGMNTIRRKSTETPLTIPASQLLEELEDLTDSTPFCGCGWPHHLLIPKGNPKGLVFDLFAIITNSTEDQVEPVGGEPEPEPEGCRSAYMLCGVVGEKYSDARPMGYPFDRKSFISQRGKATLEQFVREVPNSASVQIKIRHFDEFRNVDLHTIASL